MTEQELDRKTAQHMYWYSLCLRLLDSVDYALQDDPRGVPRVSSDARKVLTDAATLMNAPEDIYAHAVAEITMEAYRRTVEEMKVQLRAKAARPWWAKLFPWHITIERRN